MIVIHIMATLVVKPRAFNLEHKIVLTVIDAIKWYFPSHLHITISIQQNFALICFQCIRNLMYNQYFSMKILLQRATIEKEKRK